MKSQLRLPSNIKCSYKEEIVTTLWVENKIICTQPHAMINSITADHNLKEKTLARNSYSRLARKPTDRKLKLLFQ